MSYPKVNVKRSKEYFYNDHNGKIENRNVMQDKIPGFNNKYYCLYNDYINGILPFVYYHLYNHKLINPSGYNDLNKLTVEDLEYLIKFIKIKSTKYSGIGMLKYTRKISKNVFTKDNIEGKKYETVIQDKIKQILKYNKISVSDEVEVQYPKNIIKNVNFYDPKEIAMLNIKTPPKTKGQCDLLLNTLVVELKSCNATITGIKRISIFNRSKKFDNIKKFWLRVILQAWNYIERFNYCYIGNNGRPIKNNDFYKKDFKQNFNKIVVTNGYNIILAKVYCKYSIKKQTKILYIEPIINTSYYRLDYSNFNDINLNLPMIAQYITWFNFYDSFISNDDIVTDLRFYAENNGFVSLNSIKMDDYKNKVKANWEQCELTNKTFNNLINKAKYLYIVKKLLLTNSDTLNNEENWFINRYKCIVNKKKRKENKMYIIKEILQQKRIKNMFINHQSVMNRKKLTQYICSL